MKQTRNLKWEWLMFLFVASFIFTIIYFIVVFFNQGMQIDMMNECLEHDGSYYREGTSLMCITPATINAAQNFTYWIAKDLNANGGAP